MTAIDMTQFRRLAGLTTGPEMSDATKLETTVLGVRDRVRRLRQGTAAKSWAQVSALAESTIGGLVTLGVAPSQVRRDTGRDPQAWLMDIEALTTAFQDAARSGNGPEKAAQRLADSLGGLSAAAKSASLETGWRDALEDDEFKRYLDMSGVQGPTTDSMARAAMEQVYRAAEDLREKISTSRRMLDRTRELAAGSTARTHLESLEHALDQIERPLGHVTEAAGALRRSI